jgi:hypothetical protein
VDKLQELIRAMVEARKNIMLKAEIIAMYQERLNSAKAAYDLADQDYFLKRMEYEAELKRKNNA